MDREKIAGDMSWILAEIYKQGKSGASIYYPDYSKRIIALFNEVELVKEIEVVLDIEDQGKLDAWLKR